MTEPSRGSLSALLYFHDLQDGFLEECKVKLPVLHGLETRGLIRSISMGNSEVGGVFEITPEGLEVLEKK